MIVWLYRERSSKTVPVKIRKWQILDLGSYGSEVGKSQSTLLPSIIVHRDTVIGLAIVSTLKSYIINNIYRLARTMPIINTKTCENANMHNAATVNNSV